MALAEEQFSKIFFTDIARNNYENFVKMIKIDVDYAVPPGENFLSELFRVVIEFEVKDRKENQSMSMIVKRVLEDPIVQEFDQEMNYYDCELRVYKHILPALNGLEKISPKVYYVSNDDTKKVLVLEDLSASNYKILNCQKGLDLQHCLLVVEKLAHFHATSLAIYEQNPVMINAFNKGVFYERKSIKPLISICYSETIRVCEKELSLNKYVDKLTEDLEKEFYNCTRVDPNFNVVNHGDLWTSNMMFQYADDGNLKNVIFIDFQLSVFTSPAFDLHYFIATSANLEVLKKYTNIVLNHYYEVLSKQVKVLQIKAPIPSLQAFLKDFYDKSLAGLAITCFCLPFMKAGKREDGSIMNFMTNSGEGSYRHHCFNNSWYLENLKCLLSYYDSFGVFNRRNDL